MTKIEKSLFGKLSDGRTVYAYTLKDGENFARILDYGGILQALVIPDKNGAPTDVILGYDTVQEYVDKCDYHGALIGRFGNRIGNAQFKIGDTVYELNKNDRVINHLHGGKIGFDKKFWTCEILTDKAGNEELSLSLLSEDGDENYPGNLKVQVIYSFVNGELQIDYIAVSDKETVINLTNHSYFNLEGDGRAESNADHVMWIDAPWIVPTDEKLIPHGGLKEVKGTPFDFRKPVKIGVGAAKKDEDEDMKKGNGFDHCYVFEKTRDKSMPFAIVYSEKSGIEMQCFTTQPSVQLYAANGLNKVGKQGKQYGVHGAFCLETQAIPNNVNVPEYAEFGSSFYKAGEVYHYITSYAFGVRK